jgi:hypothetical protein
VHFLHDGGKCPVLGCLQQILWQVADHGLLELATRTSPLTSRLNGGCNSRRNRSGWRGHWLLRDDRQQCTADL